MTDPVGGQQLHQRDRTGAWTGLGYDELARRTRATAAALAGHGLRGRRVGILVREPHDLVPALFGALVAGAVPCVLPPPLVFEAAASHAARIDHIARVLDPRAMLFDESSAATAAPFAAPVARLPVEELRAGGRELGETVRPEPGDTALVQFTSGSSGAQKGLAISWGALAHNVGAVADWLCDDPADEVVVSWLPTHHDMGLVGFLIPPVVFQAEAWHLRPDQFVKAPLSWLHALHDARATMTAAPPFALAHLLRHLRRHPAPDVDLSHLRVLVVGAERLTAPPLAALIAALGPLGLRAEALMPAYGLAEATLGVTGGDAGASPRQVRIDPAGAGTGQRVGIVGDERLPGGAATAPPDEQWVVSSGRPLRGVSVEIHDGERRPLEEGHLGEIVVRSPSLASGFLVNSGATVLEAGVLRTGDAGFVSGGELFVLGRIGDSLKVRGIALYAEGIEAQLLAITDPPGRLAVLLGTRAGRDHALVLGEGRVRADWAAAAERLVRGHVEGADVEVVVGHVARGTINVTSSGKPRRRRLWEQFARGELRYETVPVRPGPGGRAAAADPGG